MKILVIHPEYAANREIIYMPLGLAHLCSIAEREGHEVKVLDMHNLGISYKTLERELEGNQFEACFMGGFAMQVKSMASCVKTVKRIQPKCQVMLGGVGVSDIPEIALNYTGADAVAIGESELTLPQALRSISLGRPFEGSLGFVYRAADGSIIKKPKGPVPEDLDSLPYPSYHLFDIDYISRRSYNGRGARSIHLLTSRGCPFKCNFCINSVLNSREMLQQIHGEIVHESPKTQRVRKPEKLIAEINFLRSKYGITDFHFADEEFITNRRRLEEVCSALEPLGITWSTSGRADWATEDKLARMKKSGCQYVLFGVETGSQTMLDMMDKKAKKPAVSAGLKTAKKVGLSFIANFMVGHPGESVTTVKETVEFCKNHGLVFLPAFVTLFPNSRMFHDYAKNVKDWNQYFERLSKIDFSRRLFMNLTDMPDWKLKYLRNWAVSETFSYGLLPHAPRMIRGMLTRMLQVALFVSDNSPSTVRWFIRDTIRNMFDFNSRKNQQHQVPPNDIGQGTLAHTEDTYEQSLSALRHG